MDDSRLNSSHADESSDEESFTESQWNAQKANQSIHVRPTSEIESARTKEPSHLLEKRIYRNATTQNDGSGSEDTTANASLDSKVEHSEIEKAVLLDFMSKNFLLEHLDLLRRSELLAAFRRLKATKHEVLYFQGDPAHNCYLLYSGEVVAEIDGKQVIPDASDPYNESNDNVDNDGSDVYQVFGQMAVLTNRSHTETVKVVSGSCTVFLLDRKHFLEAMKRRPKSLSQPERVQLLKASAPSDLLECLEDDSIVLERLASAMTLRHFSNGETIYPITDSLTIVTEGTIHATTERPGYDDFLIGPNEEHRSFGWRIFESHARVEGKMEALSDGKFIILSKETLFHAFGTDAEASQVFQRQATKRAARIQLQQVPLFHDSELTKTQLNGLLDLMHHYEYSGSIGTSRQGVSVNSDTKEEKSNGEAEASHQTIIATPKDLVKPALCFVRKGKVTLERSKGRDVETILEGGYFGEKMMLLDQNTDGLKDHRILAGMTIVAHANTKVDVLYLEDCRKVVNTSVLGLGQTTTVTALDTSIQWKDIRRQYILGRGGFGQVWLAEMAVNVQPSEKTFDEKTERQSTRHNSPLVKRVALKVQSKSRLLEMGIVKSITAEKNIMSSLNSPFVMKLFSTFQDESRLYMVTSLVDGGHLDDIIPPDGLSEGRAKFYAAGILEGLSYMHRHHIIHRDVKPSNVLLDRNGYPVLIDLGMAKYVPDKTYSWCGTPFLVSPEIIRMEGHDKATDYWSWAVMIYKLVTGKYPFRAYNEESLYRKICKGSFAIVGSYEFRSLMVAILYPNPTKRLGSSPQGWKAIFAHDWFRQDETFSLARVQSQEICAPWIPQMKTQGTTFVEHDLMEEHANLTREQQDIFQSFGPYIST